MADTETSKQRKQRKLVDPNETPRQRWDRLVRPRAQRLIDTAKLLGNLRGSVYDWDHEVEIELFETFEIALEGLRQRWEIDKKEEPKAETEEAAEVEVQEEVPQEKEPEEAVKASVGSSSEDSDLDW